MDLRRTIKELQEEKHRLDTAIETLEQLLEVPLEDRQASGRGRRGRKSMSEDERRQVSERMAKYWAARRAASPVPGQPLGHPGNNSPQATS